MTKYTLVTTLGKLSLLNVNFGRVAKRPKRIHLLWLEMVLKSLQILLAPLQGDLMCVSGDNLSFHSYKK